jgi:hypothetical protein
MKYLSEVMDSLPVNKILNKGAVGCGGTTLAIKSKDHYVIAVPFVSMIENKCASHPEIYGVSGGINTTDIKNYIATAKPIKIMVTYDSLGKVVEALGDKIKDTRILIDELHILFNQYSFRRKAVKVVLDNYKKFKDFCFMTATPNDVDFTLVELRNLETVTIDWTSRESTIIAPFHCTDVMGTVYAIIQMYKTRPEEHLYFFVNSVSFINKICKACELTDKEARMICSKSQEDAEVFNKCVMDRTGKIIRRPNVLRVSSTTSKPKQFNFITSAAFEGCDLMDERGRIFIVSDPEFKTTLLDISTTIPQIAGRIRNSKYKNEIYHFYENTRYSSVSYEEFRAKSEVDKAQAHRMLKGLTDEQLTAAIFPNVVYIGKNEHGMCEYDENLVNIDMMNWRIYNEVYNVKTRLADEYLLSTTNNFTIVEGQRHDLSIKEQLEGVVKASEDEKVMAFDDIVKALKDAQFDITGYKYALEVLAYNRYPWLKDAIEQLGFGKLGTLKYNQKAIKAEMIKSSENNAANKTHKMLKLLGLNSGDFLKAGEAKAKIQAAYDALGIKEKAKGSDLSNWFEIKNSKKRVDGKLIEGYTIIRSKVIFKQN